MDLRVTLQLCASAKAPVDLKQITYLGLNVRIITLSASLFSRPLVESASFCWGRCLFGIENLDLTGGLDFVCCGFGSPVVVSRIKTRSWSELVYLGKEDIQVDEYWLEYWSHHWVKQLRVRICHEMLLLSGMLSGCDRSRSRSLVVSMKEMTSNGETMWIFGTNFFGTFPRREHLQQQARCIVDEWTLATFFRQTLHACDMVEEQRQFSLNGVHGFWILKDLQSMFYEVNCDVNRWKVCFGKNRFSGISFGVSGSLFRKDDYQGWPEKLLHRICQEPSLNCGRGVQVFSELLPLLQEVCKFHGHGNLQKNLFRVYIILCKGLLGCTKSPKTNGHHLTMHLYRECNKLLSEALYGS